MPWLEYELADRPQPRRFDGWLPLFPSGHDLQEWLLTAPLDRLGITTRERDYLYANYHGFAVATREDQIEREAARLEEEEQFEEAESLLEEDIQKVNPQRLIRMAELAFGGIDGAVIDAIHAKYRINLHFDFERYQTDSKRLFESKTAAWNLTPKEKKLFKLLHELHATALPPDELYVPVGDEREAVSESYLIKHLWRARLKSLSTKKQNKYRDGLRRLQATLNDKLLMAKTGLQVWRPRPSGLSLHWYGPASAPDVTQNIPALNTLEDCMRRLRDVLASGPQKASDVQECLLMEGFLPGTIRKARERSGVTASRHGYGDTGVSIWQLPSEN